MADDVVASAQIILEGVDKLTPAANSSMAALKALARTGADVQQQLLKAAQAGHQGFQGMTQAIQATTQAAGRVPPVFNTIGQAGSQLQTQIENAFKVTAIEEFIRHSYLAYTETERSMRRIQVVTGETDAQVGRLKNQFRSLADETGRSLGELANGFRDFMSRSGLEEGQAAKAFKMIAEAADTAGVDIRDMSRLTGTAMADLKLGLQDMPHLTAEFSRALASLGPAAAAGFDKLLDKMELLNLHGPKAAETMLAIVEATAQQTGSVQKAQEFIGAMMEIMLSPQSNMGGTHRALVQGLNDDTKSMIDVQQAFVDKYRENVRTAGGSAATLQALNEVWFGRNETLWKDLKEKADMGDAAWRRQIQTMDEANKKVKEANSQHDEFTKGGIAALNKLNGEWARLLANVGALLETLGASEALERTARQIESISRGLEALNNMEWKGAMKWLLGGTEPSQSVDPKTGQAVTGAPDLTARGAQALGAGALHDRLKSLGLTFASGGVVDKPNCGADWRGRAGSGRAAAWAGNGRRWWHPGRARSCRAVGTPARRGDGDAQARRPQGAAD